MSYDPEARRATPLAVKLAERIRRSGPLTVREYMEACLHDPDDGYYRTRRAIGSGGDFVTAPEVSQVFGELIGLWTAVAWQQMGAPPSVDLVELGPGRGTLMADALRATRLVPGFQAAARVMLVEPNPVLADLQRATLRRAPLSPLWCSDLSEVPAGDATILIANEVLDCFPVFQLEHADDGWRERGVCLDAAGALQFCRLPEIAPLAPPAPAGAGVGAVFEHRDWRELGQALRHRHDQGPLAALLVDYGHAGPALGDTLQAVRGHAYEHALTSPGEADLTAQVDFAGFAHQVTAWGLACDGPITQAELLGGLGIAERGSRLMAANPRQAALIEASIARLMAPGGMGTRFKAIALRSPALPPLAGFPAMDNERLRP